ncbi:thiopurine S-methyltransferase [Photobacterium galatheae]|uniref:Thiopurine S-methyltransferase n=1 Tax=Photobacterium galatheae TaxID=1654360 RepID=A0A066RUC0_9GAMM|nr:thiopurine S-methyltransferase [Photobacterium galatheae]KDM91287.1 thiopurine S-methyltransferase [Photobacterium galatheae]MCM0150312.1 thiopurine S-methyltransferase [Photobacterium galatheae]
MDAEFWHNRWAENRIGFHLNETNPVLPLYWSRLELNREDTVFVPMCGKSLDLSWLAEKHNQVIGVELSEIAVRAYFSEHLYLPTVTTLGNGHTLYEFDEVSIYCGDYFTAPVAPVDAVYDRAALIAMPEEMRQSYVQRLLSVVKPGGKIMLVTLDYVQEEMAGPPFSVTADAVKSLFHGCEVAHLGRQEADESHPRIQQGLSRFAEEVWLIQTPA